MTWLDRHTPTIVAAAVFVAAAVWLANEYAHRAARVEKVRAYNAALTAKRDQLKRDCRAYQQLAVGLRRDPFCIERRMRQTFGLIRPGEEAYPPVEVRFKRTEELKAAGHVGVRSKMCELLTLRGGGLRENGLIALTSIFGMMGLMLLMMGRKSPS